MTHLTVIVLGAQTDYVKEQVTKILTEMWNYYKIIPPLHSYIRVMKEETNTIEHLDVPINAIIFQKELIIYRI